MSKAINASICILACIWRLSDMRTALVRLPAVLHSLDIVVTLLVDTVVGQMHALVADVLCAPLVLHCRKPGKYEGKRKRNRHENVGHKQKLKRLHT